MTAMTSGPLTVDSLLSYACLDRDAVRIVLALPDDTDVAGPKVVVRFQNDETRFRAPAALEHASGRSHVGVTVPREQIADGVWHLKLQGRPRIPVARPGRSPAGARRPARGAPLRQDGQHHLRMGALTGA